MAEPAGKSSSSAASMACEREREKAREDDERMGDAWHDPMAGVCLSWAKRYARLG